MSGLFPCAGDGELEAVLGHQVADIVLEILIRIRAGFVRYLLIGFMFFACFSLLAKGLNMLGVIGEPPIWVTAMVFVGIFAAVIRTIIRQARTG